MPTRAPYLFLFPHSASASSRHDASEKFETISRIVARFMMIIYDCFSGYISAFLCLLLCQLRTIGQPVTFAIVGSFLDSSAFCFGECAFIGGLANTVRRKMDRRLDEVCMGDDMLGDFTYSNVTYSGLRFYYSTQVPVVQSFKSSSKNFLSTKLFSGF